VLPRPVPFERFEAVPGGHAPVVQPARDLKLPQLATGHRFMRTNRLTQRPLASAAVSSSRKDTIIQIVTAPRDYFKLLSAPRSAA